MKGCKVKIEVLGDVELQRRLHAVPGKFQKKILMTAMRKAGKEVLSAARSNAAAIADTGLTKESLALRTIKSKRARKRGIFGVMISVDSNKMRRRMIKRGMTSAPVYYAGFVELGTKKHTAQPFLRSALKGNRRKVLGTVKTEVARGLSKMRA